LGFGIRVALPDGMVQCSYVIREQAVWLSVGSWALVLEPGERARECVIVDPMLDAGGRALVEVDGAERRVLLEDLVAPPAPMAY
jgi:hypothetical protein